MVNKNIESPVIMIGMHRSGTTMLIRLLEELGLFVGKGKEHNYESLFFIKLNNWLLSQSGASWDHPKANSYLLGNRDVYDLAKDYIGYFMETPRAAGYLGWPKYLKYRGLSHINVPWGWKDPRNTLTLPIWLDLFPKARVVHIYRHGVDVANSLKVRSKESLIASRSNYFKNKKWYWLRPKKGVFMDSLSCINLEQGVLLWRDYLRLAMDYVKDMGEQIVDIKYEDFLEQPFDILKKLALFCNLDATDKQVQEAVRHVRKDRAYAYRSDPELVAFAEKVQGILNEFGYK